MDDLNFVCPTLLSSVGYVGLAVGVHLRARFGAKSLRRRAISFDQVVSILMPFGTCSMMGLLFREGAYLFISSPLANVIENFSLLVTLFYVTAHSLEMPTLRRTAAVSLIAVSMALTAGYESTADRQERLWFWLRLSCVSCFCSYLCSAAPSSAGKVGALGGEAGGPGRCHHRVSSLLLSVFSVWNTGLTNLSSDNLCPCEQVIDVRTQLSVGSCSSRSLAYFLLEHRPFQREESDLVGPK